MRVPIEGDYSSYKCSSADAKLWDISWTTKGLLRHCCIPCVIVDITAFAFYINYHYERYKRRICSTCCANYQSICIRCDCVEIFNISKQEGKTGKPFKHQFSSDFSSVWNFTIFMFLFLYLTNIRHFIGLHHKMLLM